MPDYLRTLDDARKAGVEMLAICHQIECRHTQVVDLAQVIHHVGAATRLVPIKGAVHFSERMRCPTCRSRGMFIWIAVPNEPEPAWGTSKPYRVLEWDDQRALQREVAIAANLQVARGAFEIACQSYPIRRITLQHGTHIVEDSRLRVIEGDGERSQSAVTNDEMKALFTPRVVKG